MRRRAQPSSQSHSGPTSGSSGAGNKQLISVENVFAQGVLFGGDRLVRCPGHEEPPTTCGPNMDTHDEAVLWTGGVRASRPTHFHSLLYVSGSFFRLLDDLQ